jgi:hypothetical protein
MLKIGDLANIAVCADADGGVDVAAGARSGLLMVLILFCRHCPEIGVFAGLAVSEYSSAATRTQAILRLGMPKLGTPNYVAAVRPRTRGPSAVHAEGGDNWWVS